MPIGIGAYAPGEEVSYGCLLELDQVVPLLGGEDAPLKWRGSAPN